MAIKATFPAGKNETETDSLYQWDYGQVLEIESAVLGSNTVEVHFACTNMSEAIVRVCTFSEGGIVTVAIPDDCLEQSSPITAWIYEIAGTQGRTSKVIRIPVIARTRPSVGHDIPTEITDQYTQLITNVNEVIDKLENGQVSVKKAETATKADLATTAGNASTANYATTAGNANTAGDANTANYATSANSATYATLAKRSDKTDVPIGKCLISANQYGFKNILLGLGATPIKGGIFSFKVQDNIIITEVDGYDTTYSTVFSIPTDDPYLVGPQELVALYRLRFAGSSSGTFYIFLQKRYKETEGGGWADLDSDFYISYKRLSDIYD